MGAGHDHDLADALGDWSTWWRRPLLRAVLGVVALAGALTVGGLVRLWPDGSGSEAARAEAIEVGLGSERLAATVESITEAPCTYAPQEDVACRTIVVVPSEGPDAGALVSLGEFSVAERRVGLEVDVGEAIVVGYEPATDFYFYADKDRRQPLVVLAGAFAVVVLALARWRGLLALLSMGFTLALLVLFVAPSVLDGNDPLLVCVVAAAAIAMVSLLLTHGVTPGTFMALGGTLAALVLTLGVSWAFYGVADFTGMATEEGLTLPYLAEDLDLPALLLGGAVLGALGALDDVTVTQVATVAELHRRNPDLRRRDLLASGLRVGREHIAATVNTLLLAYAGASLTLVLLFAVSNQSFAMVANSELVAVEIARTLCGSIGLVAAVPLTTLLAAALVQPHHHEHPSDRPDDHPRELPLPASWDAFAPRGELDL